MHDDLRTRFGERRREARQLGVDEQPFRVSEDPLDVSTPARYAQAERFDSPPQQGHRDARCQRGAIDPTAGGPIAREEPVASVFIVTRECVGRPAREVVERVAVMGAIEIDDVCGAIRGYDHLVRGEVAVHERTRGARKRGDCPARRSGDALGP